MNNMVFAVHCIQCGKVFDRGYRISAKRKEKQLCSSACREKNYEETTLIKLKGKFASNIEKQSTGCIHWMGRLDRRGYGRIDFRGSPRLAHRISYLLSKGDPGDMLVCHSCDNPKCVNPDHLWLGTHADNMSDAANKKRMSSPGRFGSDVNTSKLSEEQAREIKYGNAPTEELVSRYKISKTAIYSIRNGKNWKWL